MNDIIENIKVMYQRGGMFLKLIFINIGVFVGLNILDVFLELMQVPILGLSNRFSFDSNLFDNIFKPWSIFTYMFIHAGFSHLLFNMIVLFFIGGIFEQYLGSKRVLSTYIIGGLAGGLLYLVTQNVFPLLINNGAATLVGASAAVMALFVGVAAYRPNLEMALFGVFNVKLYVLAIVYVGLDVFSLGRLDGVAHFAHLGGAAWGFYMGSNYKNGKDVSIWFDHLIVTITSIAKKKTKMKVAYRDSKSQKATKTPPRNDYDYNADKQKNQQKLDAILDKIKAGGYEGLTTKEKEFLANF